MSDCRHNDPNGQLDMGEETGREELLDKLVDCLYSQEGDTDLSAIDRCLEELEQAGAACEGFDAERGLEQFYERFDAALDQQPKEKKGAGHRRSLTRILLIAAAVCAFAATAQASDWNVLGAIARWTGEQFSFVTAGEQRDVVPAAEEYTSLQDALDDYRITNKLLPTKLPEESELSGVVVKDGQGYLCITASYDYGGEKFFISLRDVTKTPNPVVEINDPEVEVYVAGNVEHYIMRDVKQTKVVWHQGAWECSISGSIPKDELLRMIDSIYA